MEQSTQPPERLLPLDIDRIKQVIENIKQERKPVNEAVYLSPVDFERLLQKSFKVPCPGYRSVNNIAVFSDPIVTPGVFFICEPGLFELYKKLKTSPYVDKNWNDSQLQKIATGLWESEKKSLDKPQFEWTFTEGEKFPTGAKFAPKIPIDFIDIKGQKF